MGQEALIESLETGAPFGVGPDQVERIDTHISVLFLVGEEVFKLKRALAYPYLDFSTREKRKAACENELRLNRRTAPNIYLGVVPVGRTESGDFVLQCDGEPVDWLVKMRRFDGDTLFDRLAERNELNPNLIEELADIVAEFHAEAAIDRGGAGARRVARVIDGNAESIASLPAPLLAPGKATDAIERSRAALSRIAGRLDRRAQSGFVRHCHGDLHLRNICLWDGRPTLFDALEFDDRLATTDVFYDLAFLLMDLEHRSLRPLANRCLNRYLMRTGDYDGLIGLRLFMAVRATIRAHVTAAAARDADRQPVRARRIAEADAYLDLALGSLAGAAPRLVGVGGFSGTGKTTAARSVAPGIGPAPGAILLRSDIVRKQLAGVRPTERLPQSSYNEAVTAEVYQTLLERAETCLAAGHSVIIDAVSGHPEQRDSIERLASEIGVSFTGVWLEASGETLENRVRARKDDASDATVEVIRHQLESDPGPLGWRRIDASGTQGETAERLRQLID